MSDLHIKLDELTELYKNDEYILNRLNVYITTHLPNTLASAETAHKERNDRKTRLSEAGETFIKNFLSVNKYYYCPRIELFYYYDGIFLQDIREDDIHHKILTQIRDNHDLLPWKHKIKINIIKLLKERTPLEIIPEQGTNLHIIKGLYALTHSNTASIHLLIAIGDSIKGNKTNSYIITPNLKGLIREVENEYYDYYGTSNILSNFKAKYHGHDYKSTRLFRRNESTDENNVFVFLSMYMKDLFYVAYNFSTKYGSADKYIGECDDKPLHDIIMFTKDLTAATLVDNFKNNALFECKGALVKSKTMTYILKKYFDDNNIPNVIFIDKFLTELRKHIEYDDEADAFKDITSKYQPVVSDFCIFWEDNMSIDYLAPELEISELLALFIEEYPRLGKTVSPDYILDILNHHFSTDLVITENKYIHHVSCKLWDKRNDIESLLLYIKSLEEPIPKTMHGLYNSYIEWTSGRPKMSKKCFDLLITSEIYA